MLLCSSCHTIQDGCAHDFHSLRRMFSPECWWKSMLCNLDRWTTGLPGWATPSSSKQVSTPSTNTSDLAQCLPQLRRAGFGLSAALIASLKLGSSKSKRHASTFSEFRLLWRIPTAGTTPGWWCGSFGCCCGGLGALKLFQLQSHTEHNPNDHKSTAGLNHFPRSTTVACHNSGAR